MTSFWIVRRKAQLLLINRINTDKNFSEAKTSMCSKQEGNIRTQVSKD